MYWVGRVMSAATHSIVEGDISLTRSANRESFLYGVSIIICDCFRDADSFSMLRMAARRSSDFAGR